MNYQRRLTTLNAACDKIKSRDNRRAVDQIIDSARINADDTIRDERLVPEQDWDRMFTSTIGGQLSSGQYNRYVVAFFTTRGITF